MWKNFYLNTKGSLSVFFGVALMLIVIAVGVAVDFSRVESVDEKSQNLADSMVLAAAGALAEGKSQNEARSIAEEAFKTNSANIGANVSFDQHSISIAKHRDYYELEAEIDGTIPAAFVGIIGKQQLPFRSIATSEVELKSVEIAIVADVSWSMAAGKIEPMKAAINDFLDVIYPHPSLRSTRTVSIIPYADTVHFGGAYRHWLNPDDPPTAVTRYRADGTSYISYEYLTPRNSQLYDGCFQHEPNSQIQTGRASSLRPGQYLSFIQTIAAGAPLCPPSQSAVQLFQSDPRQLKRFVNNLELGFGTSTDVGAVWGWRALSPSWQRNFRQGSYPRPFSDENVKHLIILTDGKTNRSDLVGDGVNAGGVNREPATSNLVRLCQNIIREDKIHLTTIAYGFTVKEAEMRPILEKCVSKEGEFYEAGTKNVSHVLAAVAKKVSPIRLVN